MVGTDRVRVPASRPHATRGEHPEQHGAAASLNHTRFQVLRSSAIVLTFAAIVALATGDWWLLPVAAGVHALGTMTVGLSIVRLTTVSEHPAPDVAAAMSEEGIANPDEHFSRMVEEFRDESEHGARDVLSPGYNERSVEATEDTAAAAAQQSSSMTPTSGTSQPGGQGGAPDVVIWSTAVSLLVLSVVISALEGGWMWLLTAVMAPLLAGWVLLQRAMMVGGERAHMRGRGSVAAILVCTVVAVVVFCAIVALAFQP